MTDHDAVRARLSRLLVEAEVEVSALDRIAAELAACARDLALAEPARATLALVALDLHDYFTAAEVLFERIARALDGDVPVGQDSHRALVEQMAAEIPSVRPALLDPPLRAWLHELRAFRHVVRHAYGTPLRPDRLRELVGELERHHPALRAATDRLLEHVTRIRAALDPPG
ncbi:MAG: hypothetical protein KF729_00285 [Sandaracinaceae bacterium]|nr:hypothetical protein [Sandaracinaceae bacterium]